MPLLYLNNDQHTLAYQAGYNILARSQPWFSCFFRNPHPFPAYLEDAFKVLARIHRPSLGPCPAPYIYPISQSFNFSNLALTFPQPPTSKPSLKGAFKMLTRIRGLSLRPSRARPWSALYIDNHNSVFLA